MGAIRPTLELMAEVYRLPTEGGPRSPRFTRYIDLCRELHPINHFNPMTSRAEAPGTVAELLAIDAESRATDTITSMGDDPGEYFLTVATAGAWTDRLFSEVRWRLDAGPHIWFWAGEHVTAAGVEARSRAAVLRRRWADGEPASNLLEYAGQEGVAAGCEGLAASDAEIVAVMEALAILGPDSDLHTLIAFTFGDGEAEAGGWRTVGVEGDTGIRVCASLAADDPHGKAAMRWTPAV